MTEKCGAMFGLFYIFWNINYIENIINTMNNIRNYQGRERDKHTYIIFHTIYRPLQPTFEPLAG